MDEESNTAATSQEAVPVIFVPSSSRYKDQCCGMHGRYKSKVKVTVK
jgi:hypothetical protein